jgi:hypothetical protein
MREQSGAYLCCGYANGHYLVWFEPAMAGFEAAKVRVRLRSLAMASHDG